jgi:hypothetical protein
MAPPKRRLSSESESGNRTKISRQSQNMDDASRATLEDYFNVEVTLRSTSKAERNDPKPPEYYEELFKTLQDELRSRRTERMPVNDIPPATLAVGNDAPPNETTDSYLLVPANLSWKLSSCSNDLLG